MGFSSQLPMYIHITQTHLILKYFEGETLTKDKFGGIKKGSQIFIKKDLLSVIKLAENKY